MSKRRLWSAVLVAALAWGATACSEDDVDEAEETARDVATTVESRLEGATQLKATLSGSAEVPTPGDPDGTGTATFNLDVSKTEVCYDVRVQRIDRPTGMHIHEAEVGKAGGIVVPLTTPTGTDTTTTGCANIDATLLGRMAARPGDFYVNVHTDTYPQGALRGQLNQ